MHYTDSSLEEEKEVEFIIMSEEDNNANLDS